MEFVVSGSRSNERQSVSNKHSTKTDIQQVGSKNHSESLPLKFQTNRRPRGTKNPSRGTMTNSVPQGAPKGTPASKHFAAYGCTCLHLSTLGCAWLTWLQMAACHQTRNPQVDEILHHVRLQSNPCTWCKRQYPHESDLHGDCMSRPCKVN